MAKSKADIQRAYRERKKMKEGENYLQKERDRVKGYYVPISERPKKQAEDRRKKVRKWVREHRERIKAKSTGETVQKQSDSIIDEGLVQTTDVSSSTDNGPNTLIVKLPFQDPKKRTRTRISRATARCRREIKKLTKEKEDAHRKYKRISKRYERLIKGKENKKTVKPPTNVSQEIQDKQIITVTADVHTHNDQLTPRKRTHMELREEGVTPSKIPKVVQDKLVFANVVTAEIGDAWEENNLKGKSIIAKIVSGKLIKKYRMKSRLSLKTGIRRKNFQATSTKKCNEIPKRTKLGHMREELRKEVISFLERDDNSRMMPGKNDKVKTNEGYIQKRVLNDSMVFLHLKFKAETARKISLASFCRMRPKYIALTKYISRNKCLCQKHQNMALALKTMKTAGADVPLNPDEFNRKLLETNADELLMGIDVQEIKLPQWKKVDMADGKKRTKIVETIMNKDDFVVAMKVQIADFRQHVLRVKTQYKSLNNLKENIPAGHAVVQMDFAENFICTSADEVQSAYWNSSAVTLHPVVAYYKGVDTQVRHKNYVFVSDDLGHNIGSVYGILKQLVPELKKEVGDLKKIHYWPDSPSSQYRNKTAFYIVSDHENLLGVSASWNYFETGHGKGPCDGIGGTAKRTADLAIKQGKFLIQDAKDFFENVQKLHISAKYVFVSTTEIQDARNEVTEINKKKIVPVKGTMQIHQVVGMSSGKVGTRTTSCYCVECLNDNVHNYDVAVLVKIPSVNMVTENSNNNEGLGPATEHPEVNATQGFEQGDWVVVNYEQSWHIGQIKGVDLDDGEYEITFLRQSKGLYGKKPSFKWPMPEDILDIQERNIICKINAPQSVGRSGRSFELTDDDYEQILDLFQLSSD